MNLLIVNDEIRTAEVMKNEIIWADYGIENVYTAYDADAGRRAIAANRIDILLCDIEMPGESGLDLLRWVRKQKIELECIFLTCHANFAYAKEAIELDCQDYLLIPAKYEDIGAAVAKVVNRITQKRTAGRYEEYGKAYLREKQEEAAPQQESKKMSPEELFAAVCDFVLNHISETELSVNSIAETFYFHPVYLNRVFKQQSGIPLSQYIINKRMELACSLLVDSELSGSAIAEKVGYQHYESFHNMFKKVYGITPAQYKERHRD